MTKLIVRFPKFLYNGETEVILPDICWPANSNFSEIAAIALKSRFVTRHWTELTQAVPESITPKAMDDAILSFEFEMNAAGEPDLSPLAKFTHAKLACPGCGESVHVVIVGGKEPDYATSESEPSSLGDSPIISIH